MSTFCAKIGEFSYFLWNSSKSPPFWINPTDPHPQKSVPPFGPKIPQNGKIPPFWPHWSLVCWTLWTQLYYYSIFKGGASNQVSLDVFSLFFLAAWIFIFDPSWLEKLVWCSKIVLKDKNVTKLPQVYSA